VVHSRLRIKLALVVTKQIVSYIYMFYNIITFLLNLFTYSVNYIFIKLYFLYSLKKNMPPMDEISGSATANEACNTCGSIFTYLIFICIHMSHEAYLFGYFFAKIQLISTINFLKTKLIYFFFSKLILSTLNLVIHSAS
jgi:hypothetical protein